MADFDFASANPADLTVVVSHSGDAAAVYHNGDLVHRGHRDDVYERIIEALFTTEYVDDLVTDRTARGWNGIAPTLGDLGLA